MPEVHSTAFVDSTARLSEGVKIGPQAYIDADVAIGRNTRIGHGAHIGRWTTMGEDNIVYPGAVIGHDPQDIGYRGEEAYTVIGNGNIFREGTTVHRGNRGGTSTQIGDGNFFMVNSHVAHNCLIGNHVILVNGSLLAGHVQVDDRAIISGNCLVHQFVRIGRLALMRGGSGAGKDIPPFCINDQLNWIRALNLVGLRRNGFDQGQIGALKKAFQILFRSNLKLSDALLKIEEQVEPTEGVRVLLDFIRSSKRGIAGGRNRNVGE